MGYKTLMSREFSKTWVSGWYSTSHSACNLIPLLIIKVTEILSKEKHNQYVLDPATTHNSKSESQYIANITRIITIFHFELPCCLTKATFKFMSQKGAMAFDSSTLLGSYLSL